MGGKGGEGAGRPVRPRRRGGVVRNQGAALAAASEWKSLSCCRLAASPPRARCLRAFDPRGREKEQVVVAEWRPERHSAAQLRKPYAGQKQGDCIWESLVG